MCGIVGWVSGREPVPRRAFAAATDSLAHRGPDGRGEWFGEEDRYAFGHRRLAIVDLSDHGRQPMLHEERGLVLVFNGEIYNHAELRGDLTAKGHRFRGHCDTETLLAAYAEWGDDVVERLRGIFAFAVWDIGNKRLFAARDHLGVKPFYYFQSEKGLAFASQPRAFRPLPGFRDEPDEKALSDYLAYGVVPGERGIFKGVRKLPPGHSYVWQDGVGRSSPYWQPPREADIHDSGEARSMVREVLTDAIAEQKMSDVPLATFLSGGIDSSVVTAFAALGETNPLKSFTIGFDVQRSDETPFARLTAGHVGTDEHIRMLGQADAAGLVDDAVEAYDEPFGIGAALPMVAISRLAAENGAKVVLTGDGADELFAGYRHYDELADHYRSAGWQTASRASPSPLAMVRRLLRPAFDPLTVYHCHNGAVRGALFEMTGERIPSHEASHREREHFDTDLTPVRAAQLCDLQTYLPDEILVKVDRATMQHGVEARVPFLDKRLVELAFRIPTELHYAGGERKHLLKSVAREVLPSEILTVRKKGFSAPLAEWFTAGANRDKLLAEVLEGRLVSDGYLSREGVETGLSQIKRPVAGLLQLVLLERWMKRWAAPWREQPNH
jgi:asparagine synthase (glutamine-hydrolysing)